MENAQEIFTDQIKITPNNMRQHIDRDEIFELAEDIKKNGLISSILVRPVGDHFELVAGQRRLLAHQVAGIIKIKCIVKELTDDEALSIMTSENLARVDVNPVDEANHIARLMQANNNDMKKVAHIVSRGEQWVKDRLAVGQMPDYMQELLGKKELKLGVALILAQITQEDYRRMWVLQAAKEGVSVETARYWLADFERRKLPGGELAGDMPIKDISAPPDAIFFRCPIDGQEYDNRLMKSVAIYEGNMQYFLAFCDAFKNPPPETESAPGGH